MTRVTKVRLGLLAVLLAVGATYANHFNGPFHFDDAHTVEQNVFIRDLRHLPTIFKNAEAFSALPPNQSYRPLVTTTLAIDYALGGLRPFWYHVDSFAFFIAQLLLMFWVFARVLAKAQVEHADWYALGGTALYGLHPAIAETVNYIIARSEIMSTVGLLGGFALYLGSPVARRFGLYLLPVIASILSRQQGAMFAPLLFAYVGLVEHDQSLGQLLRPRAVLRVAVQTWPAFIVCALAAVVVVRLAPNWVGGGGSVFNYAITQAFVIVHYLFTFVLPVRLSADADWRPFTDPFDDRVLAGVVIVGALMALGVLASRTRALRPAAFGVAWFFIALAPTSSVLPLAEVMNDHRIYLPYVGLVLALATVAAWVVRVVQPSRRVRVVSLAGLLVLLSVAAVATRARNVTWGDDALLWKEVTEKSPNNERGWMNYGLTQMRIGNYAVARPCFEKAVALAPQYGYAHLNYGVLLGATGAIAEAEEQFRQALNLTPNVPSFHTTYARYLMDHGRPAEAVGSLRRAISLSPSDAQPRQLLLLALTKTGATAELIIAAKELLSLDPRDLDALLTMSAETLRAGDGAQSLQFADALVAAYPTLPEAHNNRCAALNALGRYADALASCKQAVTLRPDFQLAQNNLAWAEKNLGGAKAP